MGKSKKFFQRHGDVISFVGALIVFATFIARDCLAERWKESANAVAVAQYVYSIRSAEAHLMIALASVSDRNREAPAERSAALPTDDPAEASLTGLKESVLCLFELDGASLSLLSRILSDISLLLSKLPHQHDIQERFSKLQSIKDRVRKDLDSERALLDTSAGNEIHVANPVSARSGRVTEYPTAQAVGLLEINARLLANMQDLINANEESKEFTSSVLDRADETERLKEVHAQYAWWIAASLYTLGWSLAVIGKLCGISNTPE